MAVSINKKPATTGVVLQVVGHRFGPTNIDAFDGNPKEVLGGKGAGLVEMSSMGIPVPPGFTLPCAVSVQYHNQSSQTMPALLAEIDKELVIGDAYLQSYFGFQPLVSVRSGARVSMPGMMDTILNVGLTVNNLPEWEERLGKRAARDSFRRLIQMYGSVTLGIPMHKFETLLTASREKAGVKTDAELNEDALSRLIDNYLTLVEVDTGKPFPLTRFEQLRMAVLSVFDSWNNPRANEYRKIHDIPYEWGTACTIQAMVFGNMDDQSCTGVLFTRDPSTGEKKPVGEWLPNAQGEDVVAGIRTPHPLANLVDWGGVELTSEIGSICTVLEAQYGDMQDLEFTVQSGKLYLLQTRTGKRSALAAFKIAHDMHCEGVITKEQALQRVTQAQLFAAMSDTIDPEFNEVPCLVGIPAGGGVVTGVAMFTSEDAANCTQPCILVTKETDPDDIAGMAKSVGILTATGGLTSHAAVVARGMNKSCVVGATDLDVHGDSAHTGTVIFSKGDKITIDGASGRVWVKTNVPVIPGGGSLEVRTMLTWAFDAKQVAERIELRGDMSGEEIVQAVQSAKAQKVHIDLAALEYKGTNPISDIAVLGIALQSECEAAEIIVDVRPLVSYLDAFDKVFDRMFGVKQETAYTLHMEVTLWPKSVRERCVLVGLPVLYNKAALLSFGFKLSGIIVKNFNDLAMAQGAVEVSQEVIESVFGGQEGYELALKLIEKTSGKKLSPQAQPVYWYDAIKVS